MLGRKRINISKVIIFLYVLLYSLIINVHMCVGNVVNSIVRHFIIFKLEHFWVQRQLFKFGEELSLMDIILRGLYFLCSVSSPLLVDLSLLGVATRSSLISILTFGKKAPTLFIIQSFVKTI